MLQAPEQYEMQFKCVQMSLDDSQTSQQTVVQWRQCQCCIVCPCSVHMQNSEVMESLLTHYVFRRRSDEKLRSTKKLRGTNTLLVPHPKSWGGLVSPGPCGCCAYARMIFYLQGDPKLSHWTPPTTEFINKSYYIELMPANEIRFFVNLKCQTRTI